MNNLKGIKTCDISSKKESKLRGMKSCRSIVDVYREFIVTYSNAGNATENIITKARPPPRGVDFKCALLLLGTSIIPSAGMR
ncbi:hypothetical protein OAP56_03055 [Rickettsiaceae bacterium]|nr:hypothetical protein [Rickettsiaceae bacterium]